MPKIDLSIKEGRNTKRGKKSTRTFYQDNLIFNRGNLSKFSWGYMTWYDGKNIFSNSLTFYKTNYIIDIIEEDFFSSTIQSNYI